ncbi:FIST N-terminal domain-containing protein [Desulfuromonas sp. CSMB_57]|uniref:FIST signal transduction protein n=1 Tax=Desulfuromonas sp. CSMB_57 TaxID=2807629 RepID=UPI001CD68C8D
MAGKIREMIDTIIQQRAGGNPMLERIVKTKLILKGINPARFTPQSEDDPTVMACLEQFLQDLQGAPATQGAPTAAVGSGADGEYFHVACSTQTDLAASVAEIAGRLQPCKPAMVLFFAASRFAPDAVGRQMQAAFPGSQVFGCSTSGELMSGRMLDGGMVAMAFHRRAAGDVRVEVVEGLSNDHALHNAFASFAKHYRTPVAAMDPDAYVGLVLVDGLRGAEEQLMETIGDLTDVTFVGGSAGDDLQFSATHVYANGRSYTDAAVLALMRPEIGFSFIKTQSFRSLNKTLRVTWADEARREVLEFDDRPAAEAYADALGTSVEQAPDYFMRNPLGLIVEGEPFVRSPQQIKGGTMSFYCSIREGMELSLLESGNIVQDTKVALEEAKRRMGSISAVVNFNCILRTLELKQKQLTEDYGALFSDIPMIGFSTYGEQYIGHINQTATMLVFK